MKKLCFCLKNLDNKVPNRVKSTQLWNFCEFFQNILTFSHVCARQGDLFPTFSVGIKRKSKAPYLKVGRFYLIVLFYCKLRYERLRALRERFGVFRFAACAGVARQMREVVYYLMNLGRQQNHLTAFHRV